MAQWPRWRRKHRTRLPGSAGPSLQLLLLAGASFPLWSTQVRIGWSGKTDEAPKSLAWQQASQGPTWDKSHLPQKLHTDLGRHDLEAHTPTVPCYCIAKIPVRAQKVPVADGSQMTQHRARHRAGLLQL